MNFVKCNNQASGMLRADQIANQLGAQVLLNDLPENLSGTVVFVKDANPQLVKRASEAGCRIVYDPIDTFAYKERFVQKEWFKYVNTCITYNKDMAKFLLNWFPETKIIPHQWDARIQDQCDMGEFHPAYIGRGFNCPEVVAKSGITLVTDPDEMVEFADAFNCHVSVRTPGSPESLMKPATKLVTAAAVGAVIVTTPDSSVKELLPINYPYVCFRLDEFPRILDKARHDFGGPVWEFARCQMADLKDRTSLSVISKLYLEL